MMTYKEYTGKKIRNQPGIYQRDLIDAILMERGVLLTDLLEDKYHSLTCKQLQELVDTETV
jgi:hypothetical protein